MSSIIFGGTFANIVFLVLVVGSLSLFGVYAWKHRDRNLW